MSIIQTARPKTPTEQICYDTGYQQGRADTVVHGRWVNLGFIGDKEMVGCSECHCVSETKSDFCKDCGARMDGEEAQQ